jgi:hypothetical protein
MGSKKYKGKRCVYCVDGISDDGEHIISRKFFPAEFRANLPKAPSCRRCNEAKSQLEHYLTAVLPFSSNHITALKSQDEKVNRRLNKNLPLKNELRSGISSAWFPLKNGKVEKTIAIPFQSDKLIEYCEYIVKGLIWYEWDIIVPKHYVIEVMSLTQHGYAFFRDYIFKLSPDLKRERSFAEGGFSYTCTRNSTDGAFSAWHFKFYENIHLSDNTDEKSVEFAEICAMTGPPKIRTLIERFKGNTYAT